MTMLWMIKNKAEVYYCRTCGRSPANVKNTRKKYHSRSCRAGAWYFHCYDSCVEVVFWIFLAHTLFNAPTHSNKPQLGPQHVITMTKCGKMEFRRTGLMRSIAYRWNRLVNRKTGYRCQDDSSHRNKIEINVFIVRMMKFFRKRA